MWKYIFVCFYNEIKFVLKYICVCFYNDIKFVLKLVLKLILLVLFISMILTLFTGCYSYSESINDRFNKKIEEKCDGNTLGFTYSGIEFECQNISEELARQKLETQEYLEKIRPYMPKLPIIIDSSIRWVGNCIVTEFLYDNGKINTLIQCI